MARNCKNGRITVGTEYDDNYHYGEVAFRYQNNNNYYVLILDYWGIEGNDYLDAFLYRIVNGAGTLLGAFSDNTGGYPEMVIEMIDNTITIKTGDGFPIFQVNDSTFNTAGDWLILHNFDEYGEMYEVDFTCLDGGGRNLQTWNGTAWVNSKTWSGSTWKDINV